MNFPVRFGVESFAYGFLAFSKNVQLFEISGIQ